MNDKNRVLGLDVTEQGAERPTGPHQVHAGEWISCAPFERLLNMTIHEAAGGKAVLSMPFYVDLAQGGGLMHGGALVSLADTAVVMAVKSIVPPGTPFVTASLETKFIRPVKKGTVTAKAEIHRQEARRFEAGAVIMDDEGRPVMAFSSIFKLARTQGVDPFCPEEMTPGDFRRRLMERETFVLNVVAAWCPDCTERQRPHLPEFMEKLNAQDIPVYQMTVQREKMIFLSEEHREIVETFGGHGYPRTVLVVDGNVCSKDNVEIVTPEALGRLADAFIVQSKSLGQPKP